MDVSQLQEANEVLALGIQRTKLSIKRLRLEYGILLERLEDRIEKIPGQTYENPLPTLLSYQKELENSNKVHKPIRKGKSKSNLNNSHSHSSGTHSNSSNHGNNNGLNNNNNNNNNTTSTGKVSKTKSQKTKERDPNLPKRPTNAYLLFCEETKEQIKQSGSHDVTKALAEAWKLLNEEERKPYYKLYNEDRERYQKEMKIYNAKYGKDKATTTNTETTTITNPAADTTKSNEENATTTTLQNNETSDNEDTDDVKKEEDNTQNNNEETKSTSTTGGDAMTMDISIDEEED